MQVGAAADGIIIPRRAMGDASASAISSSSSSSPSRGKHDGGEIGAPSLSASAITPDEVDRRSRRVLGQRVGAQSVSAAMSGKVATTTIHAESSFIAMVVTPPPSAGIGVVAARRGMSSFGDVDAASRLAFQTPPNQKAYASSSTSISSSSTASRTENTPFLSSHDFDCGDRNDDGKSYSGSLLRPHSSSPLTPKTSAYMQQTSPFRSSMKILDERLDSMAKFLRRLDGRIEFFRERYHCHDHNDEEDEREEAFGDERMANDTDDEYREEMAVSSRSSLMVNDDKKTKERAEHCDIQSHKDDKENIAIVSPPSAIASHRSSRDAASESSGSETATSRRRRRPLWQRRECEADIADDFMSDCQVREWHWNQQPCQRQQQQQKQHNQSLISKNGTSDSSATISLMDIRRALWKEGGEAATTPHEDDSLYDSPPPRKTRIHEPISAPSYTGELSENGHQCASDATITTTAFTVSKAPLTYPTKHISRPMHISHLPSKEFPHFPPSAANSTTLVSRRLSENCIKERLDLCSSNDIAVDLDKEIFMCRDENAVTNECVAEKRQIVFEPQEQSHQCSSFGRDAVTTEKQSSRFSVMDFFKWTKDPNQPATVATTNATIVEGESDPQILPLSNTNIAYHDEIDNRSQIYCQYSHNVTPSQAIESVQHLVDTQNERDQLLNLVSGMRQQVIDLTNDREALIIERDDAEMHLKRCKMDVSTLEWQMQAALRMVQEVQEATTVKDDELEKFRQLLQCRDAACAELQSVLSLNQEEWNTKLATAHNQHMEDLERITYDLNKIHSYEITRVVPELEASNREEIDRLRLALEEMRSELLSSAAADIARVQSFAMKEHLDEIERLHSENETSSAKLTTIFSENNDLVSSLVTEIREKSSLLLASQAKNECLSLQIMEIQKVDADMGQQLEASQAECDKMRLEIHKWSTSCEEIAAQNAALDEQLQLAKAESNGLKMTAQDLESNNANYASDLENLRSSLKVAAELNGALQAKNDGLEAEVQALVTSNKENIQQMTMLEDGVAAKKKIIDDMSTEILEMVGELEATQDAYTELMGRTSNLQKNVDDIAELLTEKELAFEAAAATITALKEDSLSAKSRLSAVVGDLHNEKSALNERVTTLEGDLVAAQLAAKEHEEHLQSAKNDIIRLGQRITDLNEINAELQTSLLDVTCIKEEQAVALLNSDQTLQRTVDERNNLCCQLSKLQAMYDAIQFNLKKAEQEHNDEISQLKATMLRKDQKIIALTETFGSLNCQISSLCNEVGTFKSERDDLVGTLESSAQELSSLKEEAPKFFADVSKLETSIKSLRTERDTAIEKMNEVLSCNAVTEKALSFLKCEKDELTSNLEQMKVDAFRLVAEKEEAVASLNCLQERNKGLEKSLAQPTKFLQKGKGEDFAALQITSLKEILFGLQNSISAKDTQIASMSSRLQEFEQQLDPTNGDFQDMLAKASHFQLLAGKLAISVLKLKMKRKQSEDQVMTQNEKIAMLERCLGGVKADRQALAATHFHQHKKLTASVADLRKKMLDELLRKKIDHLQSENHSLKIINAGLLMEDAAAKLQLERTEYPLVEVERVKLSAENRFETLVQDSSHLSIEVDSKHDSITILEAGRESFVDSLGYYQDETARLSNEVTALKNQAASNKDQILRLESQFIAKVSETEASKKTIDSQGSTIIELRRQILSLDKQKSDMEGVITSFKSTMDRVIGERDCLALLLDKSTTELKQLREERDALAAKVAGISIVKNPPDHGIDPLDISENDLRAGSHANRFKTIPRTEMAAMLDLSNKSACCERMCKAHEIITQMKCEKNLLKKEVEHLRVGLEQAREELTTAKKDCRNISRVASKARTLLEKTENEKNQLVVDLDNAQKAMALIQMKSFQSFAAHDEQSKDGINTLEMGLSEKIEPNELVATHPAETSASIDSNAAQACSFSKNEIPPRVTSYERFTIEKGQSMFDLLKDVKKSGRKERMAYRKVDINR
ncbi:hypothetical protein ACHAW5_010958 [Stephanodiscus triporus]|uniref:Uncharacterized protein n=1 Tax=Stephanodiscus triporus TaxID=2934178 RepID=A0ABD3P122_9STRA